MNSENQKLIQAVRVAMVRGKRAAATQRKHERNALERMTAEVQLLMDDLRAEGVNPDSPEGRQIFSFVMAQKLVRDSATSDHGPRSPLDDFRDPGQMEDF